MLMSQDNATTAEAAAAAAGTVTAEQSSTQQSPPQPNEQQQQQETDVFQIAVKAEKLLQEIMASSRNKSSSSSSPPGGLLGSLVKQEPSEPMTAIANNSSEQISSRSAASIAATPTTVATVGVAPLATNPQTVATTAQFYHPSGVLTQTPSASGILVAPGGTPYYIQNHQPPLYYGRGTTAQPILYQSQHTGLYYAGISPTSAQPGYFQTLQYMPPPPLSNLNHQHLIDRNQYHVSPAQPSPSFSNQYSAPQYYNHHHHHHHHHHLHQYQRHASVENAGSFYAAARKRRFDDISESNGGGSKRFGAYQQNQPRLSGENGNPSETTTSIESQQATTTEACSSPTSRLDRPSCGELAVADHGDLVEDAVDTDDLNVMRERELNELKSKSVIEKLTVFLKYYRQFTHSYVERVRSIGNSDACTDALKMQFHGLIKFLGEYDAVLVELHAIVVEHERQGECKNNHRKTRKLYNKTKAFVRYDISKRLNSSIMEYRLLINSADRYAGMYDLIDMNNYLISMLPDIGVSIRRYINRCEKARNEAEEDEEDMDFWQHSDNSNDSTSATTTQQNPEAGAESASSQNANTNSVDLGGDGGDALLQIPTFTEYVARTLNSSNDPLNEPMTSAMSSASGSKRPNVRSYESFSKGIDALNRYLLNRIENEPTVDELVQERIVKWINKRQAKYILIFSDVDKLLNQHSTGSDCYSTFHSYLLFNLGKLITVCDSYHQKLKELLYSTTIRRKKKRKKVKLLPEAMSDVFSEIGELKRALEFMKYSIRKCNEAKVAAAAAAVAAAATAAATTTDSLQPV